MSQITHELLFTDKDGEKRVDITPAVGEISWRSHIDELGVELNFNMAVNDIRPFPRNPVDIGGLVQLINYKTEQEVFQGIVFTEERNDTSPINYKVFDIMFYLNKSEEIIQFNDIPVNQAIEKLLDRFDIPYAPIPSMPVRVDKIYNEVVSDILRDLIYLHERDSGQKMTIEAREGRVVIEKEDENKKIRPKYQVAGNLNEVYLNDVLMNPSRSRSIEEMKNVVIITHDEERLHEERNESLINQYGMLQYVENIDEEDKARARNAARNRLRDMSKIIEDVNVTLMGNDDVRAGRIIEIEEPFTGISGDYRILSANHKLENGFHTVDVTLEAV